MADPVVRQAWDAIATAVQGITVAAGYSVDIGSERIREYLVDWSAMPTTDRLVCLFDYDVPTTTAATVSRMEKRPVYRLVAQAMDADPSKAREGAEDIVQAIEEALFADVTLGGVAIDLHVTRSGLTVTASEMQGGSAVADTEVEVVLRHARGTP